jgi:predicted nucleic acid-binding protein
MKFVVDTNIVFSAVLNTQSKIGDLMMNSQGIFEFYACDTLRSELKKHRTEN